MSVFTLDPTRPPFALKLLVEVIAEQLHVNWLVEGFCERQTLVVLYGDPESGKSLIAIDIGLHVSVGAPWHGAPVHAGPVVFLCGEGYRGLRRRLAAWCVRYGVTEAPFLVSRTAAALLDPDSLETVYAAIDGYVRTVGQPVLIVVDTVQRNYGPGDENSTQDMARFVAVLDALRERYRTTVAAIAHTGQLDKSRARGSSVLRASADVEYKVTRKGNIFTMEATKAKDFDRPRTLHFVKRVVVLNDDGDKGVIIEPSTAPSGEEDEDEKKETRKRRLSPSEQLALDALNETLGSPKLRREADEECVSLGARVGQWVVSINDWRAQLYRRRVDDGTKPEHWRKPFARAVEGLQAKGRVKVGVDYAWLA